MVVLCIGHLTRCVRWGATGPEREEKTSKYTNGSMRELGRAAQVDSFKTRVESLISALEIMT